MGAEARPLVYDLNLFQLIWDLRASWSCTEPFHIIFLLFSCLGGCWIAVLPWSSRNDFSSARGWGDNNWNFHLFNQLFLRLRLSHKIIVNMFNCCPVLTELMPPAVCVSIHHCSFYLSYITFQLKELLKDKLSRIEFLWVYQSCDDVETFSFSSLLLQEGSEPPHILFHLGLKKKQPKPHFSSHCGFHGVFFLPHSLSLLLLHIYSHYLCSELVRT